MISYSFRVIFFYSNYLNFKLQVDFVNLIQFIYFTNISIIFSYRVLNLNRFKTDFLD